MMITKTKTFDVAEFLEDEQTIAEYLNMALEDPNPEMLLLAVRNIARARGMTQLARDTGLGRESLYKALSEGAKPRYDTILKVVRALGVKLRAEPLQA
jgi:probable addiction module antidote protein